MVHRSVHPCGSSYCPPINWSPDFLQETKQQEDRPSAATLLPDRKALYPTAALRAFFLIASPGQIFDQSKQEVSSMPRL
ncbi:hypothetical protein MHYP_G00075280 [Metynnis hypsauchen]